NRTKVQSTQPPSVCALHFPGVVSNRLSKERAKGNVRSSFLAVHDYSEKLHRSHLSIHCLLRRSVVGSVANGPGPISSWTTAEVNWDTPHEMRPRIWIEDCP